MQFYREDSPVHEKKATVSTVPLTIFPFASRNNHGLSDPTLVHLGLRAQAALGDSLGVKLDGVVGEVEPVGNGCHRKGSVQQWDRGMFHWISRIAGGLFVLEAECRQWGGHLHPAL